MAKKTRFTFRTTEEFKARIARVAEALGLDQAVVGEAALEAVVSYVEKHGELTIPIRIERREKKEESGAAVPVARSSRLTDEVTGLNEPEGTYPARKGKNQ
jgi:predicted transcriptional regulator